MSDEYPLTLQRADQARADFGAIADDLDFIKTHLARIPTRQELARFALFGMLTTAALVVLGKTLFR